MHELDLIRAASEDVASARVLLQKRADALDAIIETALNHGIPMSEVTEACKAALPGNGQDAVTPQPRLAG